MTIIHLGQQEARSEGNRLKSEFAARGLGSSGPLIGAVMERFNELHKDIVERAMRLILEFGDGNHQLELAELIKTTRYRLMNFANTLLGLLPPAAGRPEVVERIRHQYAALFLQRTDGALQDIEIGFIGGQKVASTAKVEAAPKLSDALTLKPTFMGLSFDLQQGWKWVRNWWQRTRC